MRNLLFLLILILTSCSSTKSVLICGDHQCINKSEAKQYFEENLSIEVKIISKDQETSFDLVDLNLNKKNKQNIAVFKNNKKRVVKKLSKEEIKIKRKEIKKKKKLVRLNKNSNTKNEIIKKKDRKPIENSVLADLNDDICLQLPKCDIESITDYLIKLSIEKDYPNISMRE